MESKQVYLVEDLFSAYNVLLPHPSAALGCLDNINLEEGEFKMAKIFSDDKGSYNFWLNRIDFKNDYSILFSKYALKEITNSIKIKNKKNFNAIKSLNKRKKMFYRKIKQRKAILELSDEEKEGHKILLDSFDCFRENGTGKLKFSAYSLLVSALIVSQNRTSKGYEKTAIISNSEQMFNCWKEIMQSQSKIQGDLDFILRTGFNEFEIKDIYGEFYKSNN